MDGVSAPTRTDTPRRPGGRSARVQSAVYTAVGELVSEGFRETMTIPQVAERAGVNPTSIYRRWGVMEALLEEVAVAALTKDEPLPDTGTISGDLREWATVIVDDITRPQRTTYLRAMVGARKEIGACPCWDTREGQLQLMIDRARQRGEDVPSVRRALDHIVAPLYHHVVFGLPADRDYAHLLVGDVMAMGDD